MFRQTMTSLLLSSALCPFIQAGDWPAFRGPHGSGVALDARAPVHWSDQQGIAWKAAMPRPGNGSPIVAQGKVLVTSSEDEDGCQRSLYCFDATTGRQQWVRTVTLDKVMPTHKTNPHGSSTPASDGKCVVVWHASAGLHCYDLEGHEIWSRNLGEFRHMWGYGTSPIIYQDRVILHTGPGVRSFVTAIHLKTGETLWETVEPQEGVDRNEAGKYMGSWSTPVVTKFRDQDQVVVMMSTRINAYDPATGEILWTCGGNRHAGGDLAYSSPTIVDDLVYMTGGFRGVSMAIQLGGHGDVTESHRLYRTEKSPQNIGSGVTVDGFVYRVNAGPSTIECIEPETGHVRWSERVGNNYWASIVTAGDLLYAIDQKATTTIFRPHSDKLEIVATNELPGACNATPAIADGRIYIRTDGHLYCVADDAN